MNRFIRVAFGSQLRFAYVTSVVLATCSCKSTRPDASLAFDYAVGSIEGRQCFDALFDPSLQETPVVAAYSRLMTELQEGRPPNFPMVESIEPFIGGTPGLGRDVDGTRVIETLSANANLATLFAADAGVWQRYSIVVHTSMVYDVFNDQRVHYRLPEDFDSYRLMVYVIALHDIAKPVAVQVGDKRCQHVFTAPLVERALRAIGFGEVQARVGENLVSHDLIGDFARGLKPKDEVIGELRSIAADSGIAFNAFLRMQKLLYIADANSYSDVRQRFFAESAAGKLDHAERSLAALSDAIGDDDLDIVYPDGRVQKSPSAKPSARPVTRRTAPSHSPSQCRAAKEACREACGEKFHWIFSRSTYLDCYAGCDRKFKC